MSAPNVNSVTLVGQLTAEPELSELPDGRPVCSLRLAVNDRRDQSATFVDVATFGDKADACAKYLSNGRQVGVVGRLAYREWEAKDGTKRSKHSVVGRVEFGGKEPDGSGDNQVVAGEEASRDE
jgi:single-strand DNA-binding protein